MTPEMKQWERTGAKDLANKLEREEKTDWKIPKLKKALKDLNDYENMTYQDKIREICSYHLTCTGKPYDTVSYLLSEDQFQAIFKVVEEEKENLTTAVMYNVDAETWDRIRNAKHALDKPI